MQVTWLAAVHTPDWQESFRSQALPSLHAVPLLAAGLEHWPVLGLQVPAVWHWSLAVHVTWLPAVQTPALQESFRSHALPSLQLVPLAAAGFEHAPVLGLHVPAVWHWSSAVQVTWLPAVQTPDWQESFKSHALPSLQAVPLVAAGLEHCPVLGLQVPAVWH